MPFLLMISETTLGGKCPITMVTSGQIFLEGEQDSIDCQINPQLCSVQFNHNLYAIEKAQFLTK